MTFILHVATSLDGYIARLDGSVDWLPSPEGGEDHGYSKFYNSIDALIMGSTTYEQVLSFGGTQARLNRFKILPFRCCRASLPEKNN